MLMMKLSQFIVKDMKFESKDSVGAVVFIIWIFVVIIYSFGGHGTFSELSDFGNYRPN